MSARTCVRSALLAVVSGLTVLAVPMGQPAGAASPPPQYYVALGDSLSTGTGSSGGADYVNDLFSYAQPHIPGLEVVNLGCGGETTTTMINGGVCSGYSTGSQLGDAEAFIEAHPGQIAFVTIDIGADNVIGCSSTGTINKACFQAGLAQVERDLPHIVDGLRSASSTVPIVGMTYYDPNLEFWLNGSSGQQQARKSVRLLQGLDSVLESDYAAGGAAVASVFQRFGTTNFTDSGIWDGQKVPVNVETICNWTWMCTPGGPTIHANNAGYTQIADAFEKVLTVAPTLSGSPPSATVGQVYSFAFAVGGIPSAQVHVEGQLPEGLQLSNQGVLLGTPSRAGTYSFSVKVSNGSGASVTTPETLTVTPA